MLLIKEMFQNNNQSEDDENVLQTKDENDLGLNICVDED